MLKTANVELLMRVRTGLRSGSATERAALADQLDTLLLDDASARATVAAAQSARHRTGQKGAQPMLYTVAIEPGWVEQAAGAAGARAAVVAALAKLGEPQLFVPATASFAAHLSKNGHWFRLVETDHGTVSVSVRRPKAGTEVAPRKTHAKNTKTT